MRHNTKFKHTALLNHCADKSHYLNYVGQFVIAARPPTVSIGEWETSIKRASRSTGLHVHRVDIQARKYNELFESEDDRGQVGQNIQVYHNAPMHWTASISNVLSHRILSLLQIFPVRFNTILHLKSVLFSAVEGWRHIPRIDVLPVAKDHVAVEFGRLSVFPTIIADTD